MNLKQLEVFLAVAETGSFSRAAEVCCLTQSTISQHVAAIEEETELRLFDRTGKGAFLTEGGKLLADHARRVMAEVREIERAVKRFKGVEEVLLPVGCSTIPGNYMIPAALPRLMAVSPGLRVCVSHGDSRDILGLVAAGEVEIAVVGSILEAGRFQVVPIGQDMIKLVAGPGHPWCGKAVPLSLLPTEPFVMRQSGSGTVQTVLEALRGAGLDPEALVVKAYLGSNEAVKQAVVDGVGVAFLSALSVERELERGELGEVKVPQLKTSRRFYLVSRAGRELSPAAAIFVQVMRELFDCGTCSGGQGG